MTEKHSPLLPCPFCGGAPATDENVRGIIIYCDDDKCPTSVESYSVASWNTRAVNGLPEAIAALEAIVNPIGYFQERAKAEGRQLDGYAAVCLSKDPEYLRDIARAALTKLKG